MGAQVGQNGVTIIDPEDLGGPSGPKIGPRPHRKAPRDPQGPPQDHPRTPPRPPKTTPKKGPREPKRGSEAKLQ